jgi:hypothetical protein
MGDIQIASTPSHFKTLNDPPEIAYAIPVRILKRTRVDLIDDAGFPPPVTKPQFSHG